MENLTLYGFNVLADRKGFFVVYPDGLDRRWRDGRGAEGEMPAGEVDDVAFISELIDRLAQTHPIDTSRVFVTGMSNGGMMSFRLAMDLGHKIAAAAPVGTSMPASLARREVKPAPVSMLIIGGVEDPIVPWEGGEIRVLWKRRGRVLSMEDTTAFWADVNRCPGKPESSLLPDVDPSDGTRVKKVIHRGEGGDVILMAIEGGGHTWPGGWQYLGKWLVGRTCRDVDACLEIWSFFSEWDRVARTGSGGRR
jgi:polyhydroxybutyrate depolymerase